VLKSKKTCILYVLYANFLLPLQPILKTMRSLAAPQQLKQVSLRSVCTNIAASFEEIVCEVWLHLSN